MACGPCGPCDPCAAAEAVDLTEEQARAAYECLLPEMIEAYGESGVEAATSYDGWPRFSTVAYQSATHGMRYVQNYAAPGEAAEAYGRYEEVDRMPTGAVLAKDSFVAHPDGKLQIGPLFLMERLEDGASPNTADWEYATVMPGGAVDRSEGTQQFCADCHAAVAETQDSLFFLPSDLRVQ